MLVWGRCLSETRLFEITSPPASRSSRARRLALLTSLWFLMVSEYQALRSRWARFIYTAIRPAIRRKQASLRMRLSHGLAQYRTRRISAVSLLNFEGVWITTCARGEVN